MYTSKKCDLSYSAITTTTNNDVMNTENSSHPYWQNYTGCWFNAFILPHLHSSHHNAS